MTRPSRTCGHKRSCAITAKHHRSSGRASRAPEFSHLVTLDDLARGPVSLTFSANEAERAALARRFGLVALGRFQVRATVTRMGDAVLLEGEVGGAVTQACVVTLEPIDSTIASRFSVRYMSPDAFVAYSGGKDEEAAFDVDSEDTEPLPEHGIDVGEVAAQYLALALEPYPRKEGVALDLPSLPQDKTGVKEGRPNPFAVLKKLQERG